MKNKDEIFKSLDDLKNKFEIDFAAAERGFLPGIIKDAEALARQNRPAPEEEDFSPYRRLVTSEYDYWRSQIQLRLEAASLDSISKVEFISAEERVKDIQDEVKVRRHDVECLTINLSRISTKELHLVSTLLLLYIIACGEAIFITVSFLFFADDLLTAACFGIPFAVAQVSLVKYGIKRLKGIRDITARGRWFRLGIVFFTIESFALGVLRFYTAKVNAGTAIPLYALNPFIFMILNLVLIAASAVIADSSTLSPESEEKLQEVTALKGEIKANNRIISQLTDEQTALFEHIKFVIEYRNRVENNQKDMFQLVESREKRSISKWICEDLLKRPDKLISQCFRNQL